MPSLISIACKKKWRSIIFSLFTEQMGETAVTIATDKLQNIRVSLWIPHKRSSTHAPINSVYVTLSLQLDYIVRQREKKIFYLYVRQTLAPVECMYETVHAARSSEFNRAVSNNDARKPDTLQLSLLLTENKLDHKKIVVTIAPLQAFIEWNVESI